MCKIILTNLITEWLNTCFPFVVTRDESRKAKILFGIVIFYVICNIPRVILNLEELVAIAPAYWRSFTKANESDDENEPSCYSPPFWAHILRIISKFHLTLNASICCFVYCLMCSNFRKEMSNQFKMGLPFLRKFSCCTESLNAGESNSTIHWCFVAEKAIIVM